MKEIYFPEFQVRDANYLKMALLYKESVSPIVPKNYEKSLLDKHGIVAHTDLIKNIDLLSLDAGNAIEITGQEIMLLLQKVVEQPELFRIREDFPGQDNANKTLVEYLKSTKWSYRIVQEKVNWKLWNYMKEEKLGKEEKKEIRVSPMMGYLYLNRLATNLSDKLGNDYILSSVDRHYRHYQEVLNAIEFQITEDFPVPQKKEQLKRRLLTQLLPKNLQEIPVSSFVALRSKEDYVKDLTEYNTALDAYIKSTAEDKVGSDDLLEKVQYYEPFLHDKVRSAIGSVALPVAVDVLLEGQPLWLKIVLSAALPTLQSYWTKREASGLASEDKKALKNLVHHLKAIE